MPAAASEPALSFWLHYAQREGALVEDGAEQAVVILPPELQRANELPEELTVSADPDVAREDGAILMIAGHPAVERAAAAVLDAGDAGAACLPTYLPTYRGPRRARWPTQSSKRVRVRLSRSTRPDRRSRRADSNVRAAAAGRSDGRLRRLADASLPGAGGGVGRRSHRHRANSVWARHLVCV